MSDRGLSNLRPAPPAPKGHTRTLKHGRDSRKVAEIIEQMTPTLAASVLDTNDHLHPLRDGEAIDRYARTSAEVAWAEAWLDEQADPVFADRAAGKVHPALDWVTRQRKRLDEMERQLAIAPLTRAQLGLAIAHGRSLIERMADDLARENGDA